LPSQVRLPMDDVFTKSKRSEVMSRIRSRGNQATELELAKIFRANGIAGWRRNQRLRFLVRGFRGSKFFGSREGLCVDSSDSQTRFAPRNRLAFFGV